MTVLFLIILGFQGGTFYELYDSGLQKLENRDYQGAIVDLEAAVALRPDSSENARTYGVQLIPYFPYHNLAKAYIGTKDLDKAQNYLELAYKKGEDGFKDHQTIAGRMEIMQEIILNYRDDQSGEEPVNEVEPQPRLMKILELFILEVYSEALAEVDEQLEEFPEHEALITLRELAVGFRDRQKEAVNLQQQREAYQLNFEALVANARNSRRDGDLEKALQFYLAVQALEDDNREARRAITAIRSELEEIGKTEEDFQLAFKQANEGIVQLQDEKDRLEQTEMRLVRENRNLNRQLDLYKKESDAPKALVDFVWEVQPSSRDMSATAYALIKSNVPLARADFFINGNRIRTWPIEGEMEFRTPVLSNYPFENLRNELEVLVTAKGTAETFNSVYPLNLPEIGPLISKETQRLIILAIAAVILVLFASGRMRKRKAFRERFNPYIAGAPVLDESMFYGRSPLLKQILNTLHNNSLMIYGERRIGKTSFLHRLYNVLPTVQDPTYQFVPVFIDLQGVREPDFFFTIEHEIADVLEDMNIILDPPSEPMNARQFTSRIRKYINELKTRCENKPKLVLLLDEVDVMNNFSDNTNQQLRSVFMKGFAEHLVAVMAGIHINKRWKSEGSPWYNFFEQIELKPFSKNYANELITQPVNGVYQFSKEAIERIMEKTGGKPYLIQKICLNLISHILAENRRKITAGDVDYVFEEIKQEFYGATNA